MVPRDCVGQLPVGLSTNMVVQKAGEAKGTAAIMSQITKHHALGPYPTISHVEVLIAD